MHKDGMLNQLGYAPNEALLQQLENIENNTPGYEKIQKHIMDLHDHLKVNNAYVALSNSTDHFKIKVDSVSPEIAEDAHEKIKRFSEKFKVDIKKLDKKETYYILGFHN